MGKCFYNIGRYKNVACDNVYAIFMSIYQNVIEILLSRAAFILIVLISVLVFFAVFESPLTLSKKSDDFVCILLRTCILTENLKRSKVMFFVLIAAFKILCTQLYLRFSLGGKCFILVYFNLLGQPPIQQQHNYLFESLVSIVI